MITVEEWATIRCLAAKGKSIRAIAKELSLSRNTVRTALRADNLPHYERPPKPNPKLVAFHEQIREMLFEKHFIGTRILRELRPLGYQGGPTALYAYLRTLKASKPDPRLTERFETPPAQQGQFDWSPYTVPLGGTLTKIIVFGFTLAFSRRKFYWPSLDETQYSIFEAIEASLRHFGGAPKELLVDNPRAFVLNAHPEHFQWNPHFLELCGHYSIQPRACQPYRARTKGKIERPLFYREEHFIKGHAWDDIDALAADLLRFASDELDLLIHSTTRERPLDRFQQEKDLLTPLPTLPFISTHEQVRKVSWDCLVPFAGSRYSVPWPYAGKQVWLRPSQEVKLRIRNQQGEVIALHQVASVKGATVIDPSHYAGLRQGLPRTRTLLEQSFLQRFPDRGWFIEALAIQHRTNWIAHLRAILGLAEVYPHHTLLAALDTARQYNTYSHRFLRGLLESTGEHQPPAKPTSPVTASHRLHLPSEPATADLTVYQRILEANR